MHRSAPSHPDPAIAVPAYRFRDGRTGGQRVWADLVDRWKQNGLPVVCEDELPPPPGVAHPFRAALWYRSAYRFLQRGLMVADSSGANRLHLLLRELRGRKRVRLLVVVHLLRREYRWTALPLFRLLQRQETWLLRNADRVLLHTREDHDRVVERGVDPARITVIPLGGGPAGSRVRIRDLGPEDPLRLLWVGGDFERKGIHPLLEAMSRETHPASRLTIIGEPVLPAESERARAAVAGHGLADRVRFLGRVSHEEVIAQQGTHDVFVAPSTHESHGIAADEALACGLPCVLTDLPAFRERLTETDVRFVPVGDAAALHRALEDLRDTDLRRRLGRAGAERAAGFPQYEDTLANYESVLREELDKATRS